MKQYCKFASNSAFSSKLLQENILASQLFDNFVSIPASNWEQEDAHPRARHLEHKHEYEPDEGPRRRDANGSTWSRSKPLSDSTRISVP